MCKAICPSFFELCPRHDVVMILSISSILSILCRYRTYIPIIMNLYLSLITSTLIQYTVKGFNFAVQKFRGFGNGYLSRWFYFRGFRIFKITWFYNIVHMIQIYILLSWQFKSFLTENKLDSFGKHDNKIIGQCLVTVVHTRRAWGTY